MSDLIPYQSKVSVMNEIPRPPDTCSVMGCTEKSSLNVVTVQGYGGIKAGAFFDFGFTKKGNDGTILVLKDGYTFKGWVTRCAGCYCKDLENQGKTALQSASKHTLVE